uniref:Integrase catalytic domain-containing protein n=1 Tax=Fagus sylvatica TaxID=28930 RepID=A0A2N9EQ76_FAGSY
MAGETSGPGPSEQEIRMVALERKFDELLSFVQLIAKRNTEDENQRKEDDKDTSEAEPEGHSNTNATPPRPPTPPKPEGKDSQLGHMSWFPNMTVPPKFKAPEFEKYNGRGDPMIHLQMYCRKMAPYADNEPLLIQTFQDTLTGNAAEWMEKKSNETFREYAQRWREKAARARPPLDEREMIKIFVDTLKNPYFDRMMGLQMQFFVDLIPVGDRIEDALKTKKIVDMTALMALAEQAAKKAPTKRKEGDVQMIGRNNGRPRQAPAPAPAPQMPARPEGNQPNDNRWLRKEPRQFTPLPMPMTELYPILIEKSLISPIVPKPYSGPQRRDFNPNSACDFHFGEVGHTVENCGQLRHRVQDLIDHGVLKFEGLPNITTNPLPKHPEGGVNMVEVEEGNEESIAWRRLFYTLEKQKHITPLDAPPGPSTGDSCEYHSGARGHSLDCCEEFKKKVTDLMENGIVGREEIPSKGSRQPDDPSDFDWYAEINLDNIVEDEMDLDNLQDEEADWGYFMEDDTDEWRDVDFTEFFQFPCLDSATWAIVKIKEEPDVSSLPALAEREEEEPIKTPLPSGIIITTTAEEEDAGPMVEGLSIHTIAEEEDSTTTPPTRHCQQGEEVKTWTCVPLLQRVSSSNEITRKTSNDPHVSKIDNKTDCSLDNIDNSDEEIELPSDILEALERQDEGSKPNIEELEIINLANEGEEPREVKIGTRCAAEQKEALIALLREFHEIFAWSYQDMPGLDTDIVVHKIPLKPECKPVKQALRRMKPEVILKIKEEVEKQLKAGFLSTVTYSDWVANIVPVPKKDGKVRMCVDYRDLNRASPKDNFPLPHIDTLVDNTATNVVFSFMDGFSGYNQIKMAEEDKSKTAFVTHWGTFVYDVMPFGLKNAGATYQRAMRLKKYQLRLNPNKCAFGVTSGKLLGFIVSGRGIEIDPAKVQAIRSMPAPRTEKEIRSFLGRINYIARFIAQLTATCEPLFKTSPHSIPHSPRSIHGLHVGTTRRDWEERSRQSTILARSSRSQETRYLLVEKDVLRTGLGLQEAETVHALLHHLVGIPDGPDQNSQDEDVMTVDEDNHGRWKLYFDGAANAVGSGIGAVLVSPKGQQTPIAVKLGFDCTNNMTEYEACIVGLQAALGIRRLVPKFKYVTFTYTPRAHNHFADALATLASLIKLAEGDDVRPLRIETRDIPGILEYPSRATENEKKYIRRMAFQFFLSGEILYKRTHDATLLRCVDAEEANRHVQTCHKCQMYQNSKNAPPQYLHTMASPWPFSAWGMDVIGAITPKASNGHEFILVAIDYFTKWVEACSFKNVTQVAVTRYASSSRFQHHNSAPYRPKMNGAVEAANKNVKKILSKMTETYKDWHEHLPYALCAYRTSVRTSVGATPYSLVYGMEAVLPVEVEIPSLRILSQTQLGRSRMGPSPLYQRRIERAYNKKARPRTFQPGDLVLKKRNMALSDPRGKFAPSYEGPYVVKKAFSGGAIILADMDGEEFRSPINSDSVIKYHV